MTDLFLVPFSGVGFGEGMDHPVHRGDTMSIGLHDRYCPMCVSFSRLYLPCVQLLMLNIRDCPPKKKQQGKKKHCSYYLRRKPPSFQRTIDLFTKDSTTQISGNYSFCVISCKGCFVIVPVHKQLHKIEMQWRA